MSRAADRSRRRSTPPAPAVSGPVSGPVSGHSAEDAAPAGGNTNGPASAVPTVLKAAAALVALESVALIAATVVLIAKTAAGTPNDIWRALFGAALALFAAFVLAACARSLLRMRPAARTPLVVLQLLAIPVGYSLGFQAGLIGYGGPMIVVAVVVLYLLFTPPARAVLDRPEPD